MGVDPEPDIAEFEEMSMPFDIHAVSVSLCPPPPQQIFVYRSTESHEFGLRFTFTFYVRTCKDFPKEFVDPCEERGINRGCF